MKIAVAGGTGRVGKYVTEALKATGHDVAVISRSNGIDVVTGAGLAQAIAGAECVVDVTAGPPDQKGATEFFTAEARQLQKTARDAGVRRIIAISIIGIDRFTAGYFAAKVVHEKAMLSGPVPVRILRAAQFHEFVEELIGWGRRGDVCYVPRFRTQLVAAQTVGKALADLAVDPHSVPAPAGSPSLEIAGPRPEELADAATRLMRSRGDRLRVEVVDNQMDPDRELYASGACLPGPHATLAGPTFDQWLAASQRAPAAAERT